MERKEEGRRGGEEREVIMDHREGITLSCALGPPVAQEPPPASRWRWCTGDSSQAHSPGDVSKVMENDVRQISTTRLPQTESLSGNNGP